MVTLTNEQSILKKNVEKELNKYIYTLDGLVTKDENSLKSIARVLDIKNIDSLNKKELIVLELQLGSYLGEDDIIRYKDKYKRKVSK